jgi:hypothetical protein
MPVFCLVNFIHHHVDYFIMSVFCLVNCHDSIVLPWLLEGTVMLITLGCILKPVLKHLEGLCVFHSGAYALVFFSLKNGTKKVKSSKAN